MRQGTYIALVAVALAAAACGGGGGGGGAVGNATLPTTPTTTSTPSVQTTASAAPIPAGYLRAKFVITVPSATTGSASSRRAAAVSPSTQSIVFTLLQQNGVGVSGQTPQTFALTTSSSFCATGSQGLTCTLQLNAPIGSDVYLAQTYTGNAGNGTLTGSGAVALSVAQNANNSANLSLTGQVASVFLIANNSYLGQQQLLSTLRNPGAARRPVGVATSTPAPFVNSFLLFVIALDASNNIILNPSVYNTPVSLQLIYPFGGQPDVTLTVVPGAEGGGTTSTSANYGSVLVNSPSDSITASIIPNVADGASEVAFVPAIGAATLASPAPAPSAAPQGSALYFPIGQLSTPSGIIGLNDYFTSLPVTSLNDLSLKNSIWYATETGFNGNFTVTGCSGVVSFSVQNYGGFAYLYEYDVAAGTCTAVISDGTHNLSIPITVTTTSVTGQ